MGEVFCDIFFNTDDKVSILLRFVDTTKGKITKIGSIDKYGPEMYQKITDVVFFNGILPTFPSELAEFFPNLKLIFIYDCGMMRICKEDLKGFTKLEKLMINRNNITYLPGDLFEFTPNISLISFVDNKISKIGEIIFDKLDNLVEVDFARNTKISFRYREGRTCLKKLKRIIRENCKPLESLKNLTTKIIIENLNKDNVEEISMVASHLRIETLMKSVEKFLELNCNK